MRKLKQISTLFLLFISCQFYAQVQKTGAVTYSMEMPENSEAAGMGDSTIKIYFTETSSATDIEMMGGMILMRVIKADIKKPENVTMLMQAMGKKYEVTDMADQISGSEVGSLKDAESVVYDKKDSKEILGYKCYKGTVKMNNGMTSIFYITEAISPMVNTKDKIKLAGFPLEIIAGEEDARVTIKATAFEKTVAASVFSIPEGYKKVTQEELSKEMGGM